MVRKGGAITCTSKRDDFFFEDETTTMSSSSGSGDPCEGYVCEFSAVCEVTVEGALCTCNFDCSGVVANRLCGSDGQDYNSTCHLNKTRCMKMENIVAMSKGRCDERSGESVYTRCVVARPRSQRFV